MKAKHIITATAAAALVIFSGCAGKESEEEGSELSAPSGVAVEVEEAGVGEMKAEYSLTGKVAAKSEVQIVPMVSGKVETVNVREGDTVLSGQMLFSIDTSTVTATLPSLKDSYNATKSATTQAVKNADIGIRNARANVDKARRGVDQALVAYENAKRSVQTAQTGVDQAQQVVTQAQHGVEQARRAVEQAQRNVTNAQAGVKNAQIAVDQAQTAVDDMYAMYEVGAVSLQDVTTAEQGLEQAKLALENANSKVLDAQAGVKSAQNSQIDAQGQVTSAQASLKSAQLAKKNAEAGVSSAYSSVADARAGVTSAQRGVESAQATATQARAQQDASLAQIQMQIDQINSQVEMGRVTAPCNGTVTAVNVTAGSMAGSSQPSVILAEDGRVEVQVSVAEDVFSKIHEGDEAMVLISTISDEPLEGMVSELPAAANPQTSLYDVTVEITSGEEPQIGAFATVTFYTDVNENAIYVPTEAILTGSDNEKYVFVISDDCALKLTVETGMVSDTDTEIVSGVEEGDLVVVKGQSYLSDGAPIHIVGDEDEENEDEPEKPDESFMFEGNEEETDDFTPEDAPFKIGTPKEAL